MQLEERFYTSTEVAQILGVSLRSVYRYLEEDKIDAEVKTATGRHRFTKQNILDFLYPQGQNVPQKAKPAVVAVEASKTVIEEVAVTEQPVQEPVVEVPAVPAQLDPEPVAEEPSAEDEVLTPDTEENVPSEQDSSVDWLSKFKAAAEKYKEEQQQHVAQAVPVQSSVVTEAQQAPAVTTSTVNANQGEKVASFVDEQPEVKEEVITEYYYRSSVGGLKDIAQGLDKAAKKSNVDYAFTMSAGLSLHKPIKPFSLLHAYVKSTDREFFEQSLQLKTSNKDIAQLCLLIDDTQALYNSKVEMHGLNVVSNAQLKTDLLKSGETDLVKEMDA